jgi:hypothetical protein
VRPELDDTLAAGGDVTATAAGAARSPGPATLAPGQQLGHFRVDKPLGAGGMGEVYLATDLALDRPVAIKVLPADLARDPTRRDRMIREARAQARVVHPNVAHIYFIGEEAGRLYFAMEYVAGKTLAERIADGPLKADEALSVIRSAALGLREAHRSGFTHRDVKPSNLMTDGHGVIKVLDFGLAAGGGAASDGPVAQTSLAGTPLYMAPEQGRGDAVDHRADIYALGATLYHLVSGAPPFQADTAEKLLSLHASGERPALPRGKHSRTEVTALDSLLARMMAPRPEDRFASYDDLLRALELTSAQHTSPGGFWARWIAASFDFFGIAMLVLAVGGLIVMASDDREVSGNLIMFPLFAVYQTLAIKRWGTTAAKALFELEVVSMTTGGRPSWRESITRSLVMCGPLLVTEWVAFGFEALGLDLAREITQIITIALFPILILLLLVAAIRTPGKRTLWDRWAGTMVRYRTRRMTNPV